MEPMHTSTWANDSRVLLNLSNDTLRLTKDTPSANADSIAIAIITLCSMGLPGNLLVIAVYMRTMTSSLRVYMFALAVADSAICVCAIILPLTPPRAFVKYASLYVFDVAVIFSMLLLVFVAMERLTAILRPHSFSVNPRRGWKALIIIAAGSVVYVAWLKVMRELRLKMSIRSGFKVGTVIASVLTITICYTLIAIALLARTRSACKRVSAINLIAPPPLRSSQFRKAGNFASHPNPTASTSADNLHTIRPFQRTECLQSPGTSSVTTSASVVPTNKLTATQSAAYKNVSLLFVITVVFIACWLPFWLHSVGVPMASEWGRLFVVNSVVNPFIYGVASAMFREDVRQFCRQVRVKLSVCFP